MAKFNKGDRVLVNGTQVAKIHTYDEASGRLVLDLSVEGGGDHLVYGPIGSYRLQHLVTPAVGADDPDEADASDESDEAPKDEITTLGSL